MTAARVSCKMCLSLFTMNVSSKVHGVTWDLFDYDSCSMGYKSAYGSSKARQE